MFGNGMTEWLLVAVVALLVLGAIWLFFLSPVYLGLFILATAVLMAYRDREPEIQESNHSVASSTGIPSAQE